MFIDPSITRPLPGDFQCVSVGGDTGKLIALGERLNGDAFTQYQHVRIYLGGMRAAEADPGGARIITLPSFDSSAQVLWSTGAISLTGTERDYIVAAAMNYAREHIGYSELDYLALAAHRLHLWAPGLKGYVASTGHMICSQLDDQCYQDAGVHLFTDGRWPGYVTPADLAALIEPHISKTP